MQLVDEAQGQLVSIDRLGIRNITDAYIDDASDVVFVCMDIFDVDARVEYEATMKIPLHNHNRLDIRASLNDLDNTSNAGQLPIKLKSTYVGFQPTTHDLMPKCQGIGRRLPIFNLSVVISPYGSNEYNTNKSFTLPKGVSEAIYTINQKNGALANFGYLSTKQIVADAYSIDVSAASMSNIRTMKNQKPYLYLLTPVTVAIDVVVAGVVIVVNSIVEQSQTYGGVTVGAEGW